MTEEVLCIVELKPGIELEDNGIELPIPLLGKAHKDPQFPDSDFWHKHVDWSRVPQEQYEKACELSGDPRILCRIAVKMLLVRRYEWLPMPKLREHPECLTPGLDPTPSSMSYSRSYAAFEKGFLGSRIDECGRCPHQEIDMSGVAPDALGRKVCPLHGLRFGRDGKMMPRVAKPEYRISSAMQAFADLTASLENR